MSDFLTYAAVKAPDLDAFLSECTHTARKIGLHFDIPTSPTSNDYTWVGFFENGWIFALSDPGLNELQDIFSATASARGIPCLHGATHGEYSRWGYVYQVGDKKIDSFLSHPTDQHSDEVFNLSTGDPAVLAEAFNVPRIRLSHQIIQEKTPPIQEFHKLLGFEPQLSQVIRFISCGPGTGGPATVSLAVSSLPTETAPQPLAAGKTTMALELIDYADTEGYKQAALHKATGFAAKGNMSSAIDLYSRLRKEGKHEPALAVVEELIKRIEAGELSALPSHEIAIKAASMHGLRGLVLYDMKAYDDALQAFQESYKGNLYLGPDHRAAIGGRMGELLVFQGRYKEAISPLQWCLAERPTQATAWFHLSTAAHRSGLPEMAREALLQGASLDARYYRLPKLMEELGIDEMEFLPPRVPELSEKFLDEARKLMESGPKRSAIAKFRVSLHHSPQDIDCAWGLGSSIAECIREGLSPLTPGDYEPVRLLRRVCFSNTAWPWSWATLIDLHMRRGEQKEAVEAVEAYGNGLCEAADALIQMTEWLLPIYPEISIQLLNAGLNRFKSIRNTAVSEPDKPGANLRSSALALLGRSLLQTNRPEEALNPLIEASQIAPENADIYHDLARAHQATGNILGANRALSKGLGCLPDHPGLKALSETLKDS